MLKKRYRLKSRSEFKRTLAGRRLCANDCFVLYGLSAPGGFQPGPVRFGFIVSRKVHKRAVVRNRIKRRLRELVRTYLLADAQARELGRFRAMVFIARLGALDTPFEQLKARLDRCLPPIAATREPLETNL